MTSNRIDVDGFNALPEDKRERFIEWLKSEALWALSPQAVTLVDDRTVELERFKKDHVGNFVLTPDRSEVMRFTERHGIRALPPADVLARAS